MSQSIGRREFLQGVAATSVLGFPFLSGCGRTKVQVLAAGPEPQPVESDKLLALAKSRMEREVKPGVILVIPSDAKALSEMESALAHLLSANPELPKVEKGNGIREPVAGAPTIQEILCQAVFVCLPETYVRSKFTDVAPKAGAILVDESGKAVASLPFESAMYSTTEFAVGMTELIHGGDGKRLSAYAKKQLNALPAGDRGRIEQDLTALDSKRFPERESASSNLKRVAPRVPAVLAAALVDNPSAEKRQRIQVLFRQVYSAASAYDAGVRLPFGVVWRKDSETAVSADPCPPCGMVAVAKGTRRFIRFLAKESK
jgi:hypothetical protein